MIGKIAYMRRIIFGLLLIWLVFGIVPVAAQEGQTYYTNARAVRMRDEPTTRGKILITLKKNLPVVILQVVEGTSVNKVTIWYKVNVDGKEGYIHSSFLTATAPATAQQSNVSAPVSPIPATAGFACSCTKTCKKMASCEEAYFQLNQCGCSARDGDHDGVPCETICPGG